VRTPQPGAVILGSDFKALGIVRSLGRRGIPCVVIDDLPRSAWFSRFATKVFQWEGLMGGPAFADFLITLAAQQPLRSWVLVPAQDDALEFVARHCQRLSTSYRLVTPDWEILRWAHDKRLLYQVAAELLIPYPRTWYPTGPDDLDDLEISLPAIIKPSISIGLQYALGRKVLPVRSRAQLAESYQVAIGILSPEALMVQEQVPGNGRTQYSAVVFCKDGRVLAGMTARRSRQYPVDYGLASSFVEAMEVPPLLALADRLVSRLRLSGMVEVEFKHDHRDGEYKLLDINVRPWGWHTLCIASGLDFPSMLYDDAIGAPIAPAIPRYGRRWRRLVTDLPAAWQELSRGMSSPGDVLGSLLARAVPSVFDWRDPMPLVGDLLVVLRRAITARHRPRSWTASDQPPAWSRPRQPTRVPGRSE
jgi:predicted ATP-grasp superfamily ATP-dependent carboligase